MIQVLSQQWQRIHPARQLKNVTNALLFLKSEKKGNTRILEQCFYRAMLCIRGTSHGPVSVCLSVCPSVCHKSVFY